MLGVSLSFRSGQYRKLFKKDVWMILMARISGIATCMTAVLLLSCTINTQPERIAAQSLTSACKGFKDSGTRLIAAYPQDSGDYCKAERLLWKFDRMTGMLSIMHTRKTANCASELTLSVARQENVLVLNETDACDPADYVKCTCFYDLFCQVPDVLAQTVTLRIDDRSFEINLEAGSGAIVLDEGIPPCE
jgi:hypothetical protein